jgi:hypothetical protein
VNGIPIKVATKMVPVAAYSEYTGFAHWLHNKYWWLSCLLYFITINFQAVSVLFYFYCYGSVLKTRFPKLTDIL